MPRVQPSLNLAQFASFVLPSTFKSASVMGFTISESFVTGIRLAIFPKTAARSLLARFTASVLPSTFKSVSVMGFTIPGNSVTRIRFAITSKVQPRLLLAQFAEAVALEMDDLVALDDGHRAAGDLPELQGVLDEGVDGLGVRLLGGGGGKEQKQQRD